MPIRLKGMVGKYDLESHLNIRHGLLIFVNKLCVTIGILQFNFGRCMRLADWITYFYIYCGACLWFGPQLELQCVSQSTDQNSLPCNSIYSDGNHSISCWYHVECVLSDQPQLTFLFFVQSPVNREYGKRIDQINHLHDSRP